MFRPIRLQLVAYSLVLIHAAAGRSEPYKVKNGDSLVRIAADHEVTVGELLSANPIVQKNKAHSIHPGMVLVIPESPPGDPVKTPTTPAMRGVGTTAGPYRVQKGDTLARIATGHGITVAQVLDSNPRVKKSKNHFIYPGLELVIPRSPGSGPPPSDPVAHSDPTPGNQPGGGDVTSTSPAPPLGVNGTVPLVAPKAAEDAPVRPSPAGDETASAVYDGVARRGWVVTYNPSISSKVLFIHRSSGGGMLTDLLYYVQQGSDGKWTVYDASDSRIEGGKVRGRPRTVMEEPSYVRKGQCNCQ